MIFEAVPSKKICRSKKIFTRRWRNNYSCIRCNHQTGAENGVQEVVIGMAHRGRLNILVNIIGKTYEQIFSEFEGTARWIKPWAAAM